MRVSAVRTCIAGLFLVSTSTSILCNAQQDVYTQAVAKGQTDLSAGQVDQALAEGKRAIELAPSRWEAYVVAGDAMELQKKYDGAIDDFSNALARAPENKKAALRRALEKCMKAQTATQTQPASPTRLRTSNEPSPSSSAPPSIETRVTQAELVLWKTIQNSTSPSDFQAYLSEYPNGAFAVLARRDLTALKTRSEPQSGQQRTMLQEAILSGATAAVFQNEKAIEFDDVEQFCRKALVYGQVTGCAAGQILITDKDVVFQANNGKIRFLSPRSATTITAEGGREGDTFSIYDFRGNRYRFGPQKFDSPYVIFLQTSLSDYSNAYKDLADEHTERGEVALWDLIKNSSNPAGFQSYLAQFPNGEFAALAKSRLAGDESAVWKDAGAGLWWTRNDNGTDISAKQALAYCSQLRLLGFSDWRVPTFDELKKVHKRVTSRSDTEFQLSDETGYLVTINHAETKYRLYEVPNNAVGFRTLCVRNAR